jgi:hypothetical protein
MSSGRPVILAAVVILVAIVGAAAAANLLVQPTGTGTVTDSKTVTSPTSTQTTSTTTTTTTTTTVTTTVTTTTTHSQPPLSSGLQLRLALNATTLVSGSTIGIDVSDYNSLPTQLNLSRGNSWPVQGLATGGCPSLYYPFGIAVFQGVYSSSNISLGKPLEIFPAVACPMMVMLITEYDFQSISVNAAILPGNGTFPMATEIPASGTYGTPSVAKQLTPFSPGTYTVEAGDEWGGMAFAYFTVIASPK